MPNPPFQAGVGRVDITPPLTMPHASWGAQVHVFPDGVEMPLYATALVVDDGESRGVWVDLDLVVITKAESDAIREAAGAEAGVPPDQVRVTVTHNHAGPPPSAWNWTRQGQAALDGYFGMLGPYSAGAVRLALANLRPAWIAAGSGTSHVGMNRRETAPDGRQVTGANREGFADPEVFVARIDGRDGSPLAAIIGYTMHPTTLGPTNRLVSPDWPGHMRQAVEALTGAPCLFAQGACGNVGPGPDGFTDDLGVVRRIGRQLGAEAARVYLSLDAPEVRRSHERIWESGAPLATWRREPVEKPEPAVAVVSRTVDLPVQEQPSVEEAQRKVDEAQIRLDRLTASGEPASQIEAATFVAKRSNMAHWRAVEYGGRTHVPFEVQGFQIGDIVLAGAQGEPFAEIGRAIKDRSPFPHTWFGGYTGAWAAYIPTAEAYPQGGYEVDTSPLTPEAAGVLVDGTIALLEEMRRESLTR
jgi:neutral ceramidase